MEAELAEWVQANRSRLPIVAFMAGRFMDEMQGMRFGHAGTIVEGKEDTTAEKIARMEAAGIAVAERIEEIPVPDPQAPRSARGGGLADAGAIHRRAGGRGGGQGPRAREEARRGVPGGHLRRRTPTAALAIVEANLDECVLCDLCIQAAPGKVRVLKLYE